MTNMEPQKRLLSLDLFRGMTIVAMILVNNPGTWQHVYPMLRHAQWNGLTFTDWIFPFFLFIVGISISLSMSKRLEAGDSQGHILLKIFRRSLILFLLGVFLYLFPDFKFATMRIPGVLQRIAVVYLICAIVFLKTSWRVQACLAGFLLLFYWLLMTVVPVPGVGSANLEPVTNLAARLDFLLLKGHLWKPESDPEGILSTLPAIGTGLLGMLTGHWLRRKMEDSVKTVWMFVFGIAGIVIGSIWGWFFPINKNLWTSSYVLTTAGIGLLVLAACYWLVDVVGYKKWTKPFVVYGANAIGIYFVSHCVSSLLYEINIKSGETTQTIHGWILQKLCLSWLNPLNASLCYAIVFTMIWLIPLWILYRKRIFIKI
jgi:predicted acyltransferase